MGVITNEWSDRPAGYGESRADRPRRQGPSRIARHANRTLRRGGRSSPWPAAQRRRDRIASSDLDEHENGIAPFDSAKGSPREGDPPRAVRRRLHGMGI